MNNIRQISVFVENKQGRLSAIIKILKDNGINIRAISIADTKDFGILRLIVSDPDLACEKLREEKCINELKDNINKLQIIYHDAYENIKIK